MRNKIRSTFLILLTVFVVQISGAYHYKPSALTTKQNTWRTACTNLERAISHLETLDGKAGDIEVSIDVNNEELRDALLEAPQHYSINVIEAWASATSAAALAGYDIYDGIILRKALSNVAGAINTQMDKVGTENDAPAELNDEGTYDDTASYFAIRKATYNDYVKEINLYNAGHSGDDIGLPTQPETKHIKVSRRTPPPPPLYPLHPCGIHRGPPSETNDHSRVDFECVSHYIFSTINCTYFPCQPPSLEEKNRHTLTTLPCGEHQGRLCRPHSYHTQKMKCQKKNGQTCSYGTYYLCSPHKHNYNNGSSNTMSPSATLSGSSSASAGNSVTFNLTTTTPFSSVYWYVAGPGESGLGTHVETDTGSSSSTSADFSYTIPSSASSGDTYTITAYIYNYSDSSVYQTSYSVSVSGSSPPVVVDNTPNCSDCTSHCSSPCSCSNSGTCNGSVYTPPSTPPSPPPPATVYCARAACAAEVSDRLEHRVESCTHCGSVYWTCYPGAINNHETTQTCRRPGCGATFTRCSNGTCTSDWGTHDYHWAQ